MRLESGWKRYALFAVTVIYSTSLEDVSLSDPY